MRFDDWCVAAEAPGVLSTGRIAGRELAAENRSTRFPAPCTWRAQRVARSRRPRPAKAGTA